VALSWDEQINKAALADRLFWKTRPHYYWCISPFDPVAFGWFFIIATFVI
jgi:hypothetical protein